MPVIIDPMKNAVLREWYEEARSEGLKEGLQQGEAQSRRRLQFQLERRFGPLPDWAVSRLATADSGALDEWSLRILEAASLEGVLGDGPGRA